MATVKDLVHHYESLVPRMSPDLERFLDLIWSHRNDPYLDVYALYTGTPASARPWATHRRVSAGEVQRFLAGLVGLGREPAWIQCGEDLNRAIYYRWSDSRQTYVRRGHPLTLAFLREACTLPGHDWVVQDLAASFFHYSDFARQPAAMERIYLDIRTGFEMTVFRWVVESLVFSPKHPDCIEAKVGGPLEHRYDSIVVYFRSAAGVQEALAALAVYQERAEARAMFDFATPRLTRPIREVGSRTLVGVGIGSEPPGARLHEDRGRLNLEKTPMSFGTMRESVLLLALSRTLRANGTKADFQDEVIRLMKEVGLDPRQPDIQLLRDELEARAN